MRSLKKRYTTVADLVVPNLVRSGSAPKTYNYRPTVIYLIQSVFSYVTVGR